MNFRELRNTRSNGWKGSPHVRLRNPLAAGVLIGTAKSSNLTRNNRETRCN